jgi:hypothetical protein
MVSRLWLKNEMIHPSNFHLKIDRTSHQHP